MEDGWRWSGRRGGEGGGGREGEGGGREGREVFFFKQKTAYEIGL